MSAPSARTSPGYIALTVAAVPSGMNAGVRMTPRGVEIAPVRAGPSRAETVKAKTSVTSVFRGRADRRSFRPPRARQQARIAVAVEAIARLDRMNVGAPDRLQPTECAGQHEQRRARQMEVG